MKKILTLITLGLLALVTGCGAGPTNNNASISLDSITSTNQDMKFPYQLFDAEWRKKLTPDQYHVLREAGTEMAFTGKYWNTTEPGVYRCAACGAVLFKSDEKFDSGCGWPSFSDVVAQGHVVVRDDDSYGMHRKEVLCANCGSHLGHVFDDGPGPTGLRYCINSASINLSGTNDPAWKAAGGTNDMDGKK